jgi:Tat protein secretion system quality control protein TatD with DNase activity
LDPEEGEKNEETKELQKRVFIEHFTLAEKFKLPMYFCNKNANPDFYGNHPITNSQI